MTTIVTRAGKGSSLSYAEMDANFTNLNNAKLETGHPATDVLNVPSGTISATNVQAAINELDTEKAPKASPIFTGTITVPQYYNVTQPYGALQVNGADIQRFGSDNSGQLAGFRNRIINGDMRVAQRGVNSALQGYQTVDRMYCNRTGGVLGLTQQAVTGAFGLPKNTLRLIRDAGNTGTANINIYQAIEGKNTQDFAGKTVTASINVGVSASTVGTSVTLTLYYQTTGTDIGPAGLWTSISSSSQTISISSATVYSASFAVPSNATQVMLQIAFSCTGTAGADESRYVTDVQLELGSIATPFESRPIGLELALCQRYYRRGAKYAPGWFDSSTGVLFGILFPSMRIAPIASFVPGVSGTAGVYEAATASRDIASIGTCTMTPEGGQIAVNTSTAGTLLRPAHLLVDIFQFSAEL